MVVLPVTLRFDPSSEMGEMTRLFLFFISEVKRGKNGGTKATRPFPECTRLFYSLVSFCVCLSFLTYVLLGTERKIEKTESD